MDGAIRAALPILAALLSVHTRTSEQYQAENNNRTNYIKYMPTIPPFPGANRTMGYNPTMGPSSLQNNIEEPMFFLPEGYFYWLRPNWEGELSEKRPYHASYFTKQKREEKRLDTPSSSCVKD
ncbi:hypothetical protein Bbelb_175480 [Branchiostoma belcheri]|nr:hypothetical protein Bbelb_175480 [Branchiostoma belcheri]